MASTYEKIATNTLGSDTATVTFSSIPGTYTDIRIVVSSRCTGAQNSSGMDSLAYYNADQGSNYSQTQIIGNGSTATSNRNSNITYSYVGITSNKSNNEWPMYTFDIMNYANTTTYKTTLARVDAGTQATFARVTLWRSTAAITSITLYNELSLSFKAGSTFTIYGILKA